MTAVSLGTFTSTLASGMVSVSLPTMTQALSTDLVTVAWVIMAYLLAATGLLLLSGRLADLFGRREVYLAGFLVFTLGAGLASLSPSIFWLIGARVVQGLGASALMANGAAMLSVAFGASQRGRVLGLLGAVVSSALMAGPLLGGFLVEHLGWRAVFYINIGPGLAGAWICSRVLVPENKARIRPRLDLFGAASLASFITTLVMLLSQIQRKGWGSFYIHSLFIASLGSFVAFVLREKKTRDPIIDFSLFRNIPFLMTIGASFFYYAMAITNNFLMPFYLQRVLGFTPAQVGMILVPIFITIMLVAPISGRLSDRVGSYFPALIGIVVATVAFWSFTRLTSDSSVADIIWRQVLLGVGMGLFSSPNHSAVLGFAPKEHLGLVSSLIALFRNLGFSSGLAIAGAVVAGRLAYYQRLAPQISGWSFLQSLHDAWWVAAGFGGLACIIYIARAKGQREPEPALP